MMTGTALAQGLSIGVAPILTRLYTPADYGVFAIYAGVCAMATVLSTGHYDPVIMLPERDEDAFEVMLLALAVTAIISVAMLVVIAGFSTSLANLLGAAAIARWLYLVPLVMFVSGIYQCLHYWSTRRAHFKRVSAAKISGSAAGATVSLGLGVAEAGVGGLIFGSIANPLVAGGLLGWRLLGEERPPTSGPAAERMRTLARRYYKYPLLSSPIQFLNAAVQQAPVFLLHALFGSVVVGFYALTQRTFGIPLGLVTTSVLDVFRQRANSDYLRYNSCRAIYVKTTISLIAIGTLPFLIFFATAPHLFGWVFGHDWTEAGDYAQILTPLFFLRFITTPAGYVLYIARKQQIDLIGQVVLLLLTTGSILVGGWHGDAKLSILLFTMSYCACYLFYLTMSYMSAGQPAEVVND